jgi:hypothetical protein
MDYSNPSPEELQEWFITATKRNAILPSTIYINGHYVTVTCGNQECLEKYTRKLLPNRNDPIMVCPLCHGRNYVPVEW